jgi:hypothetical protein
MRGRPYPLQRGQCTSRSATRTARKKWQPLNRSLKDPVKDLFIANMDPDDNIDDILRLEVRSESVGSNEEDVTLIWWRSKNGIDRWREFKRYTFRYPSHQPGVGFIYPKRGFVGHFGDASAGTLVVDTTRIGHFFVADQEWTSLFPY